MISTLQEDSNCFKISNDSTFSINNFGDVTSPWKKHCGSISNVNYDQGYHYKLQVRTGNNSDIELINVLEKIIDAHYSSYEEIITWIGPEKVEVPCLAIHAPKDCKEERFQSGDSANAPWNTLYDNIVGFGYTDGSTYKVQYTKRHFSDFEKRSVADDFEYQILDIKILKEIK